MDPATIAVIGQVAGQLFSKMGDKGGDQSLGQLMQMLGGMNTFGSDTLPKPQQNQTKIGGGY